MIIDNKDAPQNPLKPIILGQVELLGGCIRVRISVKNTSELSIPDATLELKSDENILHFIRCEPEFPETKSKIKLGSINPDEDRTIALYLEPLICTNIDTDIDCRLIFTNPFGITDSTKTETLKINVICPILHTEKEINVGRLKELTRELKFQYSKVYIFPNGMELGDILISSSDVFLILDVKHIKTLKTTDERTYESWYYGRTSGTEKDLLVKCAIRRVTRSIEIMASGNDPGEITGLLAQIGHDLTKNLETLGKIQPVFNLHIKDYITQRSDLLIFCDLDGNCRGDIVIEKSLVQRSNLSSKNSGEREQSEKEDGKSIRKEEKEQQKKIGNLIRTKEDKELLAINKKEGPEKNKEEEARAQWVNETQKGSNRKEDLKTQKKEDQEHRSRQKERQEKEDRNNIEIIPEKSKQRKIVETTIFNKIQESSKSGYLKERGVNFEGIGVDKLVGSLTHTCKNILYMVDEFPIDNGRVLYLAGEVAGDKSYYLLTTVVREFEGFTQVLLRANSDKNYGINDLLDEIQDNMRHTVISAGARENGIISKEQVTIIIDSILHTVEVERAHRKREEQERLQEEETKKRKKEEQELKRKEQIETEHGMEKKQKEAKITEKAKNEQERITKADLSAGEKKESLFRFVLIILVLMAVFLVLEYWALGPFANDPNQSPGPAPTLSESFTNFNGMEFVLIRAGEFDMGSPANEVNRVIDEGPVHHVKIPNAFYMGKYEVTQKQWREVMENNPSTFKGDDLPVEQVSWNDAQEFIKKLNENEHVNKYRLPTEAQWEYAARAATTTRYFFGNDESALGDYAWYIGNAEGTTHKVGLKNPNPFGLYDMHGNVFEWVQDSYHDSYKVATKDGSVGDYASSSRVFRGGSWISNTASCRLANREDNDQGNRASNLGFRLVRDV